MRKPAAVCPHCHKPVKALIITWRQMEVLMGIMAGKELKEIAYTFKRSVRTIEEHQTDLYQITGTRNVAGLIEWAQESGFTFEQAREYWAEWHEGKDAPERSR